MVHFFWLKVHFATKCKFEDIYHQIIDLKILYGKFMLFFLHFEVHQPNLVMHLVALNLWNVLHFVDKPTWAWRIMAYKNWFRVHRVYSNGDPLVSYSHVQFSKLPPRRVLGTVWWFILGK